MATTPFLHGGAAAAGEQKQRNQGDGSAKNGLSAASGKQRGRKGAPKSQGPKKPARRGMGVYQLEQQIHREEWKKRASGDQGSAAAASGSALRPPSYLDTLTGTPVLYPSWQQQAAAAADSYHFRLNQAARLGASSAGHGGAMVILDQSAAVPYHHPCNCNGFFKKKRTETYELPEKSPVTGYFQCGGQTQTYTHPPNQVGATFDDQVAAYRNILESSALFGRKMCTEYEFFPQKLTTTDPTQGDHHHGHVGEAIDLSLRL